MLTMLIKKEERVKGQNSDKCIYYEYPLNDKDLNITYIEIEGKYPDKGKVVNEKVKEIVLVTKGECKITVENKEYELKKDDALLIQPNQKYCFSECKQLGIITVCNPTWCPEQHKETD